MFTPEQMSADMPSIIKTLYNTFHSKDDNAFNQDTAEIWRSILHFFLYPAEHDYTGDFKKGYAVIDLSNIKSTPKEFRDLIDGFCENYGVDYKASRPAGPWANGLIYIAIKVPDVNRGQAAWVGQLMSRIQLINVWQMEKYSNENLYLCDLREAIDQRIWRMFVESVASKWARPFFFPNKEFVKGLPEDDRHYDIIRKAFEQRATECGISFVYDTEVDEWDRAMSEMFNERPDGKYKLDFSTISLI